MGVFIRTSAVRHAAEGDLVQLLELYQHLHPREDPPALDPHLQDLWGEMLADAHLQILVAEVNTKLVATCTLILIQNLTRGARPYGLIENVVTHAEHRRQGYGKRVVEDALGIAWRQGCYKVMLLTGNADVVDFYRTCGFVKGAKTGLVAYPNGL